jgi:ketosteroid isomerase-like protein
MEPQNEIEEIRKIIYSKLENFCNAVKNKNIVALKSDLHDDIIFIPHNFKTLYGCDQVCHYYKEVMEKSANLDMKFKEVKINIAFPNALVVGKWEARGKIRRQIYNLKNHFKTEEETITQNQGRFTAVFQQEKSEWLLMHVHSSLHPS